MSRTLSTSHGSGDSLNVSVRCGCNPKARQIRLMVALLRPVALGARAPVGGAPRGRFQSAHHHILDLCVVDATRGARPRFVGQAGDPVGQESGAPLADRGRRHVQALGDAGRRSAQARMMRARRASCGALCARCASEVRCCRSSSVSVTVAGGRPLGMRSSLWVRRATWPPKYYTCLSNGTLESAVLMGRRCRRRR